MHESHHYYLFWGLPRWLSGKDLPTMQELQEMQDRPLGREDPLEEGMAIQLQYSCPENPMDRGAWRATVHKVTKSCTRLKQLSMYVHTLSVLDMFSSLSC